MTVKTVKLEIQCCLSGLNHKCCSINAAKNSNSCESVSASEYNRSWLCAADLISAVVTETRGSAFSS